jgi:hypothetical protein
MTFALKHTNRLIPIANQNTNTKRINHNITIPPPPTHLFVQASAPRVNGFGNRSGADKGNCRHILVVAQRLHYFSCAVDLWIIEDG